MPLECFTIANFWPTSLETFVPTFTKLMGLILEVGREIMLWTFALLILYSTLQDWQQHIARAL